MSDDKVSVKEALEKPYDLSWMIGLNTTLRHISFGVWRLLFSLYVLYARFTTLLEHLIYRCGLNFYY